MLQLPKIIQQIGLIIGLSTIDKFVAMYIIQDQWKIVCQMKNTKNLNNFE